MATRTRPPLERVAEETKAWDRKDLLDLDDFSAEEIGLILHTADAMREVLKRPVPRVPALRSTTVVTLFYEPSTRTRASFERAAKVLSADTITVAAAGSSAEKGESLIDTVRTLESLGAGIIVMRHPQAGAPYLAARHVKACVINGGDGAHAHPTQALLDLYTIQDKLGRVAGLKVVIVGDIAHSRVARSNIWGLTRLGAQVTLCGPATLLPPDLARAFAGTGDLLAVEEDLETALEGAHVVMTLRLQQERQAQGLLPSIREYVRRYQINGDRFRRAHPQALLLHPGPVIEGVEISAEVARSAHSVIDEQVENGVAVRMALLYLMAGKGEP